MTAFFQFCFCFVLGVLFAGEINDGSGGGCTCGHDDGGDEYYDDNGDDDDGGGGDDNDDETGNKERRKESADERTDTKSTVITSQHVKKYRFRVSLLLHNSISTLAGVSSLITLYLFKGRSLPEPLIQYDPASQLSPQGVKRVTMVTREPRQYGHYVSTALSLHSFFLSVESTSLPTVRSPTDMESIAACRGFIISPGLSPCPGHPEREVYNKSLRGGPGPWETRVT